MTVGADAEVRLTLEALERRLLVLAGRWSLGIIGTIVIVSAGAVWHWSVALGRISSLEDSSKEAQGAAKANEAWIRSAEGRLGRIEALTEAILNRVTK